MGNVGGREMFEAGDRSVVVMEGGALRVVVPNPQLVGNKYFDQDISDEEEGGDLGEEETPWGDGTTVTLVSGNQSELVSCRAEAFGSLVV